MPSTRGSDSRTLRTDGSAAESGVVAGVDAAGDGWAVAITSVKHASPVRFSVWRSLDSLWAHARSSDVLIVGVDMPVGLPGLELRTAEIEARELLGPRRSSIFWSPPLCTLDSSDHAEANRLSRELTGRGLSAQGFALMPKIREVRDTLGTAAFQSWARPRAVELHPETSFAVLAGAPMSTGKRHQAGIAERLEALSGAFPNIVDAAVLAPVPGPPRASLDDLLDAAAAAWTCRRVYSGEARCLGAGEMDETSYPMNIWV